MLRMHADSTRFSPSFITALGLGGLLLLGTGACSTSAAPTEEVAELRVVRGDLTRVQLLTGELVAEEAAVLVAPDANVWPLELRWLAEDGTEVRQGERLVEFDTSSLSSNLDDLRNRVLQGENDLAAAVSKAAGDEAEARFQVEQAEAALAKAQLEADVPEDLLPARDFQDRQLALQRARLELDKARVELASRQAAGKADVEVQRLMLGQAREEVRRAEQGIALLTLYAPRDGILLVDRSRRDERTFQAGDTVYPGETVARLPDLTTLMVEARVFDVDDGRVVAGMPVVAVLDTYPELSFHGRVREVDGVAQQWDRASLRRYFRALVDLDELDPEHMRPGMSVRLELTETAATGVLLAPRQGLDLGDPAAPRARRADGSWAAVSLGPCDAFRCVVLAGLAEGDRLEPGGEG